MKKLLLIIMFLPFIGFGQCISGDCENGYGTEKLPDTEYVGNWKDGKKHGYGTLTSKQGTYKGDWKDGKVHGNGVFKGSSLDYDYDGEYVNGKKTGYGIKTWVSGDKYEGYWVDDVRTGQGTCTYANGNKYEGYWVDDVRNGQGTYTFASGNKYVGEWKDDKKNGFGTSSFPSGNKYVGEWKDGSVHGKGIFVGNEYTYDGKYVNGKQHGFGTYTYANGNKYVGEHKDDKKEGEGVLTWANGNKYIGQWKNNKQWGRGTEYNSNGTVIRKGNWYNGTYQERIEASTTFKPTVTPSNSSSRSKSYTYSSYTYSILSYDFNNNIPFNIRWSQNMIEDEIGFYIGVGLKKIGKLPGVLGAMYVVENGRPVMYDNSHLIGNFGPMIEKSTSDYFINFGITRHLFYAFYWSGGLGIDRHLVMEKREHFFDSDLQDYWGIEWLKNKDESTWGLFIETDVYLKIFDVIAVKYGIVYKNSAINSVVGVGFAF